jgi:hypothetical protein
MLADLRTGLQPLLWLLLALPFSDDEIVKEFKRYFRKYKDTPTRVEAVAALEDAQSIEVVDVLVPLLKDKQIEVVDAAVQVLAHFKNEGAIQHLLLRLESEKDPRRRVGMLRAVAKAGYPGSRNVLIPLLEDGNWDVRRRTIQGLRKHKGPEVEAAIVALCQDKEAAVRCEALDALAYFGSKKVLPAARNDLVHEVWQVRASAIAALSQVRDRDSIEPLLERLDLEDGRLRKDIGDSLGEITGRNFGQRVDAWKRFWEIYKDRFKIPTDQELKVLRQKQKERKEFYAPPKGAVSYHGVDTPSRSIIFVIDVSGSMEQEITEKDLFVEGDYPSLQRIDIIKTELIRTIEGLEPYVKYNVLSFATEVKPWKKSLVRANPLNRSSAVSWVKRLEAIGGDSKQELARAGLVGAANLEAGKTNSFGALMAALGVDEKKGAEKGYAVDVDTIFFLSDGYPSYGRFIETDDVLREVRKANQLRGVVIHTIALGEFEKDFMRRLAHENGGTFVDLGS